MSALEVDRSWRRIEAWLMRHAPDIAADLNPPASPEMIMEAERQLESMFPDDVRASFRIHDGQGGSAPWSFPEWRLLAVGRVVHHFEGMRVLQAQGVFDNAIAKAEGPVQAVWWSRGWIPLLSNGSGDYLCVDVDPPAGGRVGQLLEYWSRDESRRVVAPAFAEWLSLFAKELEAGRIGRDQNGSLIRTA